MKLFYRKNQKHQFANLPFHSSFNPVVQVKSSLF